MENNLGHLFIEDKCLYQTVTVYSFLKCKNCDLKILKSKYNKEHFGILYKNDVLGWVALDITCEEQQIKNLLE